MRPRRCRARGACHLRQHLAGALDHARRGCFVRGQRCGHAGAAAQHHRSADQRVGCHRGAAVPDRAHACDHGLHMHAAALAGIGRSRRRTAVRQRALGRDPDHAAAECAARHPRAVGPAPGAQHRADHAREPPERPAKAPAPASGPMPHPAPAVRARCHQRAALADLVEETIVAHGLAVRRHVQVHVQTRGEAFGSIRFGCGRRAGLRVLQVVLEHAAMLPPALARDVGVRRLRTSADTAPHAPHLATAGAAPACPIGAISCN